jgi:SNF2 family DNA or RNA helicase
LGSYWNFINEYCYFSSSKYGGYQITGIKDAKKLHETLKSTMIRRKKAEVFRELPEIIHNEYYVPLTPTQEKMYNEIKTNIMNLAQKDDFGENALNQIMYLRELCNSPRLLNPDLKENGKVDEIIEIVKQFSSEHKILIFSQWTKFLDLIVEELIKENIQFTQIRGDIQQEVREENITKFNSDHHIRILLSSDAGNVGLNLQIADVLIHCDLLWNPMKMQQRNGRIHRIGQKNTVNIITIMTEGTIEEKVYNILQTKKELFDKIIEGKEFENIEHDVIRKIFKTK